MKNWTCHQSCYKYQKTTTSNTFGSFHRPTSLEYNLCVGPRPQEKTAEYSCSSVHKAHLDNVNHGTDRDYNDRCTCSNHHDDMRYRHPSDRLLQPRLSLGCHRHKKQPQINVQHKSDKTQPSVQQRQHLLWSFSKLILRPQRTLL